jgi:WD40 repeat protein
VGSADSGLGQVVLHDLADGVDRPLSLTTQGRVQAAAMTGTGTGIVVADTEGIRLYGAADGLLVRPLAGPTDRVQRLWVSPNDRYLVCLHWESGMPQWTARIHDLNDESAEPFEWQAESGFELRFAPDSAEFVTWDDDGRIALRSADLGDVVRQLQHGSSVELVDFSPEGSWLVTCGRDGVARLWDRASGQPFAPALRHQDIVYQTTFSEDLSLAATASADGTARLWDVKTGEAVSPPLGHGAAVRCVAFHPTKNILATGADDGIVRLWDISPDSRSPETLRVAAELLASRRLDANGGLVTLTPAELRSRAHEFFGQP